MQLNLTAVIRNCFKITSVNNISGNIWEQRMQALSKKQQPVTHDASAQVSCVCVPDTQFTPLISINRSDEDVWEGEEEEEKKRQMKGRCFTIDGSLPVAKTESKFKCCLDWRVDKNSLLSEHRLLYQAEEKCRK